MPLAGCAAAGKSLLVAHVHGIGVVPDGGGRVLRATHDGPVMVDEHETRSRVGPAMDLTGFAVSGPDRLLASGRLGPGVDVPEIRPSAGYDDSVRRSLDVRESSGGRRHWGLRWRLATGSRPDRGLQWERPRGRRRTSPWSRAWL